MISDQNPLEPVRGTGGKASDLTLNPQDSPRNFAELMRKVQLLTEYVDTLRGMRGNSSKHAVLKAILDEIGTAQIKSTNIAAAPTAAQFNALLADVKAINDVLTKIADNLQS